MPDSDCFHPDVPRFLEAFGCRLLDIADIAERIEQARRGRDWSGMTRWIAEIGPRWANDWVTLVFEVPLEALAGRTSLAFSQEVWMLQPSNFEFLTLEGHDQGIVRMWWERGGSGRPTPIDHTESGSRGGP